METQTYRQTYIDAAEHPAHANVVGVNNNKKFVICIALTVWRSRGAVGDMYGLDKSEELFLNVV